VGTDDEDISVNCLFSLYKNKERIDEDHVLTEEESGVVEEINNSLNFINNTNKMNSV